MDDPTGVLRSEHACIKSLLGTLDAMAEQIRERGHVDRDDLHDAMTVVVEFADRCHSAKEEDVLFPALAKASAKTGAEIARRLSTDHVALRRLVREMRDLLPEFAARKASRRLLAKSIETYTRTLREHMRAEDEMLLPEVDRSLSPEERDRVAEAFRRVEREEVGLGMQEAYRSIIQRLASAYALPVHAA